ncbi:uncharacterized protein H6S33_003059 [Morchella sextelata]|uniref:uncharacterized protein n=1 Tax=Morchella sextelata TaxID=1174677 RepID=UPI001D0497FD|nr:uncharacterized protein H6S33_003059 [Morchella sextelata]KAH0607071.1 hypothetical protein H6S33_003059 [Morchella sextelata]
MVQGGHIPPDRSQKAHMNTKCMRVLDELSQALPFSRISPQSTKHGLLFGQHYLYAN